MDIERVILTHLSRYPLMQLQDFAKLIYQNEFGSGHLLADPAAARELLRSEWAEVNSAGSGAMLLCPPREPIGGGLYRVHLLGLPEADLPALGDAFERTALAVRGSAAGYEDKLSVLPGLSGTGPLPFSNAEALAFLQQQRTQGYPHLRHSEIYHREYRPAYRVVEGSLFVR